MREVEARLKISAVDRTGAVLGKLGRMLSDVSKRVDTLNRQQSILARSSNLAFGAIGKLFAAGVVANGVKDSIISFADMERQMTRIGITADASAEQTNAAFETMQQQAKEMAVPLDQAVRALDTLVSSGMDLKSAMEFLPSVLATAQASGADTADIANTAIKAASALKLEAREMQKAFDIMVAGGKAGQFELKDMAQYIPDLANSFASLGYQGEDGLKKLIALLQTVREDTGSSEAAATNLGNVLGKIYSEDTASKFKKMGIDLNAELAKAKKNGEDTVAAFVRISNEAIKGDLTKLPRLFTDQQFRLGMQSLMTSAESYEEFLKTVNDSKIDGTVFRDLKRVTDDTQASIDRLSASYDKMMRSVGGSAANVAVPIMDKISEDTDKESAALRGYEKQGHKGGWAWWKMLNNMPIGLNPGSEDYERAARVGGFVPSGRDDLRAIQKSAPFAYETLGRLPNRPISQPSKTIDQLADEEMQGRKRYNDNLWGDGAGQIKADAEASGQAIKQGGSDFEASARRAAAALEAAATKAASALGNVKVGIAAGPGVNANTGKTNGFVKEDRR